MFIHTIDLIFDDLCEAIANRLSEIRSGISEPVITGLFAETQHSRIFPFEPISKEVIRLHLELEILGWYDSAIENDTFEQQEVIIKYRSRTNPSLYYLGQLL